MSDRRIKNISRLQHALPIHVKGEVNGKDVVVLLAANEVFWCPDDRDTKSLLVYAKKGFLELTMNNKPDGASYFEAYPDGHWDAKGSIPTMEEVEVDADVIENATENERVKWEDDEITYLKRTYPKKGLVHCVEKLGRSKNSVKKKIESLGLKRDKPDDKE